MFETLPDKFRTYGLPADVRTLLIFRKSIDRGLVKTLGDIYLVLKGIVVKDPRHMGPYTQAYYDYFLNIKIKPGESLESAVLRSETFKQWVEDYKKDNPEDERDLLDLVDEFLNHVHLTSYDIKRIINGKDIIENDDANKEDKNWDTPGIDPERKNIEEMADYSDMDLEDLLERMRQIAEQQKGQHSGGNRWIGTGGTSPFGHSGAAKGGIRTGGKGGGKMARQVLGDRNYYPVERDSIINDNNVDAALASLKGIIEETAEERLDVQKTIKNGLKQGGIFLPEMEDVKDKKLQVILLIDNGGYSMMPYVRSIQDLFKKMKTRFAHDLETYYFHNTIYNRLYTDARRTKWITVDKLLTKDPNYRVFVLGDASMAPYELNQDSVINLGRIAEKFKKAAWLNPEPKKYWHHTMTVAAIGQIFPMHPLTPRGIEEAVLEMNRKRDKPKS